MFKVLSIPESATFASEQQLWFLVEPENPTLSIKRNAKTRKMLIPYSVIENSIFEIGNNCKVAKLLLFAKKNDDDNLNVFINSIENKNVINELVFDFNTIYSFIEILKDIRLVEKIKSLDKDKRADQIAVLLKLSEEEKTKHAIQINENLKVFFDLQEFGELQMQVIEDWEEDKNIEKDLTFVESKIRDIVNIRENMPLFEIINKKEKK